MTSFPGRDGERNARRFSTRDIRTHVSDMDMGTWVSSLVCDALNEAAFANDDFMGRSDDIVSIPDLIQAMTYYATQMGYCPSWETGDSASAFSTFEDFRRRPGVYKANCKKVDNWSTLRGARKLASVKKRIRRMVADKAASVRGKPSSLGVFVGEGADMGRVYFEKDHRAFVCSLHRLGQYPQDNPRFYIHMVYRYCINELHRQMADDDKVLRFPTIQKVMDIRLPVNCVGSLPPEFRTFLQNARGNVVKTVTLPVPSKEDANEVVYDCNFETTVPWVAAMRSRIFDVFVLLGSGDCPHLFREIYPKFLVKGDQGRITSENSIVVDALARSIEMNDLIEALAACRDLDQKVVRMLDRVLLVGPSVASVFPRYSKHRFQSEGEQLRERLGFLLQDSVRGVFRHIASKIRSFCDDIYVGLGVPYVTIDVFIEYCNSKSSMKFQRRSEAVWRDFIIDTRKICRVLHAWSRKTEVDQFVAEHGTADSYLKHVFESLEA